MDPLSQSARDLDTILYSIGKLTARLKCRATQQVANFCCERVPTKASALRHVDLRGGRPLSFTSWL